MGVSKNTKIGFFKAWHEFRRFKKLKRDYRKLVFYSEGKAYWPHLGPLVRELVERYDFPVTYVSSSPDDPGLLYKSDKVNSFCIGLGTWCTMWFLQLDADVLVMTMPDIETYHIKRSKSAPVHYVYVQHAPVSTHMMYREQAFDNFDTIFMSGPHQLAEIRLREKLQSLKPKQLFAHGYCCLDDMLKVSIEITKKNEPEFLKITIAPSWGDHGILNSCGQELLRVLLQDGCNVVLRPHPQSLRVHADVIAAYKKKFGRNPHFTLDCDASSSESIRQADVLITDWSGVAFDYAFVLKQPVLFIEVPRKVKNPNYTQLPLMPLEVAVREEIGEILEPGKIQDAPEAVRRLAQRRDEYVNRCEEALHKWIYNVGTSASVGAAELIRIHNHIRGAASSE